MLEELQRVLEITHKNQWPFYIEHNDFLKGGLVIHEEVSDLLKSCEIDAAELTNCVVTHSVWSARYYFSDEYACYRVAYASTFDRVIKKILEIMESHDEVSM